MDILQELKELLITHECYCYEIDESNNKLIYVAKDMSCTTLNQTIVDITGFLLRHHIHYEMFENRDIVLHLNNKTTSLKTQFSESPKSKPSIL